MTPTPISTRTQTGPLTGSLVDPYHRSVTTDRCTTGPLRHSLTLSPVDPLTRITWISLSRIIPLLANANIHTQPRIILMLVFTNIPESYSIENQNHSKRDDTELTTCYRPAMSGYHVHSDAHGPSRQDNQATSR